MKKAILGKKVGMTQIFTEDGTVIPVTVVEAGPCVVVQKKTKERDGYNAVQVGFGTIKEKKVNKPIKGHFDKTGAGYQKYLKELKLENSDQYEPGQEIKVDIFAQGDHVDVSGISKGKGFAGTIKRWNQHRGPMSHGSRYHRGPGAMTGAADPSKVFKSKRMAGHMGHEKVTVQNLEIARIDPDRNLLLVKGALPGPRGGLLFIKETVKNA